MLRTSNLGKALAFVVLLASGGLALPAKATLILDLDPGGFSGDCQSNLCGNSAGRAFGWAFDVTSAIQVNGLAAWNSNIAGFNRVVQTGLWTDAGTLLASVTISDSSPTEPSNGDGVWLVESIAALILTPGRYVLGQVFFDDGPAITSSVPFTTIPEVTLVGGRADGLGPDSGLAFPGGSWPVPAFGPNLRLGPAQLPEPTSIALLGFGLGLVGISSLIRRRRGL